MYKKVVAGVMALAIVASGAGAIGSSSVFNTMTVSAAQQGTAVKSNQELGESDFNSGKGLPWHVCENGTGKLDFDISNGTYNIKIVNPGGTKNGGEDRWDCQFRHRGLTIEEGHTYRITYSVKASNAGHMYAKIGNMVDDDQELWHSNGKILNMPTLGTNATESQVVSALKSASTTGQEVKYYEGWDKWKSNEIPANKWVTYAYEFKYVGDQNEGVSLDHWKGTVDGTAEMTFHFGGQGPYTASECFPAGTELQFDNMALIDLTDSETNYVQEPEYVRNKILVNQIGYVKGMDKKATLVVDENDNTPKTFTIVNAKTGKTVYTGKSTPKGADADSGDYVHILDFSKFDTVGVDTSSDTTNNGVYYIKCNGEESYKFNISDGSKGKNTMYKGMLSDALNYFYQNRSGVDIESKYITSGDKTALARAAGHNPDVAYVQSKWVKSYASESDIEKGTSIDVTGGWYDAGDHGKYVVNGGISVWTLQNMYERAKLVDKDASKFADGTMSIPENNNGLPDLLDETKVEMDFLLKMQRSDGMVYHKMHDYQWTGLAVKPEDDKLTRIVKPVTTAATLNLAATAAQSYRLWKDIDSTYANKCLAAAKKAYTAAKANPALFAPDNQAIGGGAYGDQYVDDDFYWAACELYAATGDKTYYTDLKGYQNPKDSNDKAFGVTTSLMGGENKGSKTSFTWGSTAALGTLTLSLYQNKLTSTEAAAVKSSITKAADDYLAIENKQGYGLPYEQSTFTDETNHPGEVYEGYEWGSNSMVVNNAIVMAYAADINKDKADKYANGVFSAMDYIFGRNAGEYSYVTGYGEHHTKYPHHRFWSGLIDKSLPTAPSGVLSGGPNSGIPDPWIRGAGYKIGQRAPQLCYLDHVESWGTNECTINWNAPFAWVVSYMEDYKPTNSGSETPSTTTDLSDCTAALSASQFTFTGGEIKPAVKVKNGTTVLKEGTDYTVAYKNNAKVGTGSVVITGKGDYTGTITKTFKILPKSLKYCTVAFKPATSTYNGLAQKPSVQVKIGDKAVYSGNYTVTYKNNVNAGTATVTLTGKGNLQGTLTKTFKIAPKSIKYCTVQLKATSYSYTGSAIKPAVRVKIGDKVISADNYTVAYKNNTSKGTASVKITGKGNLQGYVVKTFTIK